MSDGAKENIEARLLALRAGYLAGLEGKLAEIQALRRSMQTGAVGEAATALRARLHTLAGSGATFGFAEVGNAARAAEESLLRHADGPDALAACLRQLGVAVADAMTRPLPSVQATYSGIPHGNDDEAPRRVFVLEDDPVLNEELTLQLRRFGYEVEGFLAPADLRARFASESPPAAIVADVMFPQGDDVGIQTMAELQSTVAAPLPVVFISNRDDVEARLAAVRAGGEAYFTKPVDVGEVIDRLDRLTRPGEPEPYRILIVEDSLAEASHNAALLEAAGMRAQVIIDPLEVMTALGEFNPDLILLDLYMPRCTGLELAKVIRQHGGFVSVPIVFLSSESDVDRQMVAVREGGDDFIHKTIRPAHLVATVESRVRRYRALRSLMLADGLTGLLNHTTIKEQLDKELHRARRQREPLAFAMLDIDHFKQVNDTYGHATGDRVLRTLARLLRQRMRRSDIVGRYGGEEFAVILPDTDLAGAVQAMDAVRDDFARIKHLAGENEFIVTFSCGVAAVPDFDTATAFNEAADQALYVAKRGGRNRVEAATQEQDRHEQ